MSNSTLWLADTDTCIEIQKALRFLGLWQARVQKAFGGVGQVRGIFSRLRHLRLLIA